MANKTLGSKIYELRKKKGLTQEDLAILLDISDKSISKWENDMTRPTIENLGKLSKIFDISIDELLVLENKEEKKKVVTIALTGGPCAGKTTAKSWILNTFQKQGYKVLFIEEGATELITSGLAPGDVSNYLDFQRALFQLQLFKENLYMDVVKKLPDKKVLIVCDRGLFDQLAYTGKKDFLRLLKENHLTEALTKDRYDAVFHLVSAAKGAKEYYNLDNQARSEDILEANRIDDLLLSAWMGHPHFRVIDNSCSFDIKMQRLMKEIAVCLGEPEPYEIERKFLIEMPDLDYLDNLENCQKVQIVQTYLTSLDNHEVRIRQRGINGSFSYTKTEKIPVSSMKRIEIEKRISQDDYIRELTLADPTRGQIIKDRYCLMYKNQYFEIDIYPFWNRQAILEIELMDEKQKIELPDFLDVIEEITDKEEYQNSAIAKRIKKG